MQVSLQPASTPPELLLMGWGHSITPLAQAAGEQMRWRGVSGRTTDFNGGKGV